MLDALELKSATVFPGRRPVVHLRFGLQDTHPIDNVPLRLWVRRLPGAAWDAKRQAWTVPLAGLKPGVLSAAGFQVRDSDGRVPTNGDMAPPPEPEVVELPEWFGLDLAPFQKKGTEALLSGKRLLADAPGVGKTRQALAAVASLRVRRALIVCPPVVVHHWAREILASRPAEEPPMAKRSGTGLDAHSVLVVIEAGKKQPEIPEFGTVLVPDSLIGARTGLLDALRAWRPDVLVYDEAHRAKTWDSHRSIAMRHLSDSSAQTFCLTGTPLFASPVELLPVLHMTGHLHPIFGGWKPFVDRYLRLNRFNQWVPVPSRLGELKDHLDANVWLRRTKDEVLVDLPPKSRRVELVDVDLTVYRSAHKKVVGEIRRWLSTLDDEPEDAVIEEWARDQMGLVSMLRASAGLCKIGAATDWVQTWLDGNPGRPLVVWTHHRSVSQAMVEAVKGVASHASIIGGTPSDERGRIVDGFQAGHLRLLVCSISAAGVGITLTRASDALFVETDWTPALLTQAEDRICRMGQTQPVTITTLVAPGTLDEQIQTALARKSRVLDAVLGRSADNHAEVLEDTGDSRASVLGDLVRTCLSGSTPSRVKS